jgi:glycerol-3-phosphate dehydrogenase
MFDVAVIGAGVSGSSIARRLSSYRVRVALIERCADVSFGVSKANSGIIHAGFLDAQGAPGDRRKPDVRRP